MTKPIANIILNGEKLNAFLLRSGTRQRYRLSPEVLAVQSGNKKKEIKDIHIGNNEVKLSLLQMT